MTAAEQGQGKNLQAERKGSAPSAGLHLVERRIVHLVLLTLRANAPKEMLAIIGILLSVSSLRQATVLRVRNAVSKNPSKESSAAPAPKQQETASSSKDGNKDAEAKKANAQAKPKDQAKVFFRISSPASTCFTTIKSKKVHFSKFSQKKSIKDEKLPTYTKWNVKTPDFVPKRTNPDGTVKF